MFHNLDPRRNEFMLTGSFAYQGYDWWWHSFTGINEETGEEKPFFIEAFTCNPALGGRKPVLGQDVANRAAGRKPSYVMFKAGAWGEDAVQLHRFFGWDQVLIHGQAPYSVTARDCFASDKRLKGSISISKEEAESHPEWMCGSGEMSWDLKLKKKIAYNVGYGASKPFRDIKAFEMYWHAEGIKTLYKGWVIFNGVRYKVEPKTSYGYADKNWGSDFTSPWVWLSSNCLRSKVTGRVLNNSVFEIGGGRPKVFGVALDRKLLGGFYYEGKDYEFNFSKFWTGSKTEFSSQETEDEIIWHVRQENLSAILVTEVHCQKKDMLLVNYEAPNGQKRHNRLWNGGNGTGSLKLYKKTLKGIQLIDEVEATHIGCEYGEYDR